MAETQPKLHPALLRLSAIISHYFMRCAAAQMMRGESHFQRHDAMLTPMSQESANRMFKYDEKFKKRVRRSARKKGIPEEHIEAFMASFNEGKTKVVAKRGFIVST